VSLQLVVISRRQQILSTDYFEHFGLSMADCTTAVVKSRGHFRAGFQHFVPDEGVLEVDVPGLSCQNLGRFTWSALPRPVWPLDLEAKDLEPDWGLVESEAGPLFILAGQGVAESADALATATED
jgi:microcystin degradation protein MlrC